MKYARRKTTELGPERLCIRCDEWWPDDGEFWYRLGTRWQTCKACQREWNREYHQARKLVAA